MARLKMFLSVGLGIDKGQLTNLQRPYLADHCESYSKDKSIHFYLEFTSLFQIQPTMTNQMKKNQILTQAQKIQFSCQKS